MSVEYRYRSDPGHLGQASVKIGRGSPGQPCSACCKKTSTRHNNELYLDISLKVGKV